MALQFYPLKVSIVRRETEAAVQIGFAIPPAHQEAFRFDPGQYLTISLPIEGKQVRRAYSISSATQEAAVSILIKRVEGGLVSNHLNDQVEIGQTINVLPPNGKFKLEIAERQENTPTAERNYYFFGAGSGITPLMSMVSSLLENEPSAHCYLLYGNRDQDNMIFRQKIDRLQLVYHDRLQVKFILSRPLVPEKPSFFSSEKSTLVKWEGEVGRVDKTSIQHFFDEVGSSDKPIDGYYICGPGTMIEATYDSLVDLGIDKRLIHREYFSAPVSTVSDDAVMAPEQPTIDAKAQITLDGKTHTIDLQGNTNVVQALMDQDIEPPYSCLSGTCSTCRAKLEKGKVHMDVSIGLEDDEEENGYILTCQAQALTEELIINYDTP